MDTDRIVEIAPHYVAMILLAFIAFAVVGAIVGQPGFWARLLIIAVVVFAYRPIVMSLGIGPSAWEREPESE